MVSGNQNGDEQEGLGGRISLEGELEVSNEKLRLRPVLRVRGYWFLR